MKPVTEDQVQTLLDGLERREKEALRALSQDARASQASRVGGLTAKVFRFRGVDRPASPIGKGDVVALTGSRTERRTRVSSKGFFFYTSEPRAASQT